MSVLKRVSQVSNIDLSCLPALILSGFLALTLGFEFKVDINKTVSVQHVHYIP